LLFALTEWLSPGEKSAGHRPFEFALNMVDELLRRRAAGAVR
jgi:hypothetical protein